jgi:signal transduction histidine kinase
MAVSTLTNRETMAHKDMAHKDTSSRVNVAGAHLDDAATEAADYTRAILNILDDIGEEREKQAESQRAVLNILEDIDTDKIRLQSTQKALLNILDDFDAERLKADRANIDLRVVNEAMGSFIDVAAHDLRSPLASMVGFSSLLTENWATLSEQNRLKFVSTINRQSHKLADLVNDLLTLSSIEGGVLRAQPESIVLSEAISACLAAASGDTASVSVSCAPHLVAWVDPNHLERIIDNYVQNAFKYGDPPVRIEVTYLSGTVEIRVIDHGPGVPPEFKSKLFGKFARADVPNTRDKKGSGLGLSIVRGLAEANGGLARYEPILPHGSCFLVILPESEPGQQ